MAKYKDIPGNAMGSVLAYQRALMRLGEKLNEYERTLESLFDDDIIVNSMSIRHPMDEGEEYLVTVRVVRGGESLVGFHAASTLSESLEGLLNRLRNKSMKWKADKYAKE